jgi:enediyne biosynthesis protein E4
MAPGDGKALVITDLDNNGWPDVVIAINDGETRAFETQARGTTNRCRVQLQGRAGNGTGVGARVELILTDGRRMAEVYAGSGYLSQSSAILNFGLAPHEQPTTLKVRWPSGRSTSHHLGPNQPFVTIRE